MVLSNRQGVVTQSLLIFRKISFFQIKSDQCVFLCKVKGLMFYLALYIYNCLLLSSTQAESNEVLQHLKQSFQIIIASAKQYVGFEVTRNRAKYPTVIIIILLYLKSTVDYGIV